MATFQLQPGFNDVEILTDEADTIAIPEGEPSRDRVFNFDPASDRIDISRISGVTPQELLDNSRSRPNSLLLVGSFGRIALFGVAADQLSEDNFITTGGNQPPIAFDDFAITMVGTALEIPVLDNDFDFEGDIISIIDFEATTIVGGTVSLDNNDTPDDPFDDFLTYMPAADFFGTDSFIYTISDGEATATAVVNVEVGSPVEPVLIALDDSAIAMVDMAVDIDVLANDPRPADVDAIAIASFDETTANGGTVTRNDNGTPDNPFDDLLTYMPAAGFLGTDSFSYRISNSLGTGTAEVTVEVVLPIEPPPVATDDFAETTADIPVDIDVLANDFTLGGGPEVAIASFEETTANGGTVILNDNSTPDDPFDDSLEYTPAEGFTGTDSFSYTISNALNIAEAQVRVQVVPTPTPPPSALDDFASTTVETPVNIDVLANDFNPTGDRFPLGDFQETTANGGTVTRDDNETDDLTDDSLIYTPAEGFIGVDSFTYSVSDVFPGTGTATVTVEVQPDEEGLVAVDDTAIVQEDRPETIAVLENDFNSGGPFGLIFFERTTENGGTVTRDNNDTPRLTDDRLVYTPAPGFTGVDSFTYSIGDADGNISTATVDVTVPAPGPVAVDDSADLVAGESETIAVLENDFNPDGDPFGLIFFERTTENGGTVTRDNNDTPRLTDDKLIYTAADGFIGEDSFTYSISDALGNISTAVVNVTVSELGENEPPVAIDDVAFVVFDLPVTIAVLNNDFDLDGDEIAIAGFDETTAEGGTVVRDNNGSPFDLSDDVLIYTPDEGLTGTDNFSYTVSDSFGLTDTATVQIIGGGPGQPPIAIDDFATTFADSPVDIFVLDNDFDPEGDPIAIAGFDETTVFGGTVTFSDNDDFLTYTPAFGFSGTDSFSYTISDDLGGTDTATVSVAVIISHGPPPAVDDFAATTENVPVDIFVLNNDFDPDGDQIAIAGFPETTALGGTVTLSDNDTPDVPFDDFLTYSPPLGFTGTDSFSYTISNSLFTGTAVVTVAVESIIDEFPVPADDFATTVPGTSVEIFVLENDGSPDGNILLTDFPETTTGGTVVRDNNGSPFDLSDDFLIYTPDEGFTGTDSFSYTVSDNVGLTDTATVTVTVNQVLGLPLEAEDDSAITVSDVPVDIFVLDNDSGPDGVVELIDFEETSANGGMVAVDDNDTASDLSDDFLIYTPASGFIGTDTFTYIISDSLLSSADTATVTVTVNPGLGLPLVAEDDFAFTDENIPVDIFVLDNDSDADGDQIAIAGFPGTTVFGGTVTLSDNDTPEDPFDDFLTYSPVEGFTGTDSFSYTITDGLGTDTATVTVAVEQIIDEFPVPVDDVAATVPGTSVEIFVLENDGGPDGNILLTDFPETTAAGGTVIRDNNGSPFDLMDDFLIYTPDEGFTGTDSFIYTVSDDVGLTDTATVTVTVNQVLGLPLEAEDDSAITVADVPVEIFVLDNDSGPDGVVELIDFEETSANGGMVAVDDNDTASDLSDDFLIYTPASGFIGTDTFTYIISDSLLSSADTATVTVTVDPGLGLPLVAEDDFAFTTDNVPVAIAVLDNDSGSDGLVELIDFEDVTINGGIVSLNNNGTPSDLTDDFLTYLPAFGFSGIDSFSYSIGDGSGQTQTGFVTVEVGSAANEAPIAVDDLAETFAGIPVNIPTLDNDFDPTGNPLVTIGFEETTENGGTVARDEDGSLIYTPPEGFTGTDGFTYNVIDSRGFTDTAFVSIVVDRIPLDLPPLILDREVYTSGNEPVDIFVLENQFDPRDIRREIVDFEDTPEGGTVTLNDNGTPDDPTDDFLTYTPTDEFTGTDLFGYSVSDDRGFTSRAFVTVTVLPEGQSAVAIDDFTDIFFPEAGNEVNIFVLENDISLNGDAIALTDFDETTEGGGTVTRNDNGTPEDLTDDFLLYTAGEEFSSTDSFSYSISDGSSTDTAVVDVVNFFTPPFLPTAFAVDDTAFIIENSPGNIPVLRNDFSFGESAELTDFDESTAAGGTITRNENGTPEDLTDDFLVYTPATDFVGTDSFTYSIIDDFSFTSSTAVVNVIVVPADSIVSATDDNAEAIKNNPTSIFVVENDFEVDGNPLEIISFDETTVNGGTVSLEGFFLPEIDAGGDARATDDIIIDPFPIDPFPPIGGQGYLLYSPAEDFTGTDSFTYSISNGDGFTDTATVRVTVEPSAPFAGFPFGETFENAPVTIDLLSSAFDQDRDSISLTDFEATSTFGGTISLDDNGTPSDQTDDSLIYSPATGFTGFDDFNYTIIDSSRLTDVGEVSVNVLPAPAGVAAVEDFVQTIAGLPVQVGVLDNDFEIDDRPLELISFEQETENGGIVTRFENNTPSDRTDDYLVYSPGEFDGEFGFDSFSYTIANVDGSTDTGVASVSIAPMLTTFANFDRAHTFADLPINIDVLANDFTVDNSPVALSDFEETGLFAEGTIARDDKGTVDDLTDDSLIYRPGEGFTGYDEFSYSISDVAGNTAIGFVSVTIDPLPEAGFAAIYDLVNTSDSEPVTIPVLDNDFDIEGNLELASFEETTFYGGTIAREDNGTPDDLTDDELRYTPPAEGTHDFFIFYDSFSYTVRDPDSNSTDRAIVDVEISPEPPSASDDTAETLVNTAVNIPVVENDFGFSFEPGDPFSSLVISGFETTTANGGQVILDNNDSRPFDPAISDSLIYIPAPGFTGTDSFSYNISDGFFGPFGASANSTALVTVTVLPETDTLGL